MVIPVAAGIQTAKSFKHAVLMSVVFAQISVVLGIVFVSLELASGEPCTAVGCPANAGPGL